MADKKDSKFETSQIISMFPTFVWETVLKKELSREINSRILEKLSKLQQSSSDFTPSGSWQSHQRLHESEEFQPLVSCINAATASVLKFLKIEHEGIEITDENTDQVMVRVEDGMLLLFPSWLLHSVDANESDKKRISLSFNIMFSTYVETMSKPLW